MTREELPADAEMVRSTGEMTDTTVPAGLLRSHRLADGVWGRLVASAGRLRFVFEDDPDHPLDVAAGADVVIPPGRPHRVEITGPVTFRVDFHRSSAASG